jgi:hypothetical protein
MSPSPNLIAVIEECLSRPLDADLVAGTHNLQLQDLQRLHEAYGEWSNSFRVSPESRAEFWPLTSSLIGYSDEENDAAEAALQRAMTRLLYVHGTFALDSLDTILVTNLTPKWRGRPPRWEMTSWRYQAYLGRYFAGLSYLRPLIDAGLIVLLPQPATSEEIWDSDDERWRTWVFEAGEPQFVVVSDRATSVARELTYGASVADAPTEIAWDSPEEEKSLHFRELGLSLTYQFVVAKLNRLHAGYPGDLYLQSQDEVDILGRLLSDSMGLDKADAARLRVIESIAMPGIGEVQASDVVSLHDSDAWGDYRLALQRGIGWAASASGSVEESAQAIRDELASVQRAAARSLDSFESIRGRFRRDLALGVAAAAGLWPAFGPSATSVGLATSGMSAVGELVVDWLGARRAEARSEWASRCFLVFG